MTSLTNNIILTIIEKYIDFTDIIIKNNNYKEQIIKYLQHNFKENPKFNNKEDNDNQVVNKLYVCELIFKDKIISRGEGRSKKKAQQDASRNALIHYNVLN